jgi:hypothetical protein
MLKGYQCRNGVAQKSYTRWPTEEAKRVRVAELLKETDIQRKHRWEKERNDFIGACVYAYACVHA